MSTKHKTAQSVKDCSMKQYVMLLQYLNVSADMMLLLYLLDMYIHSPDEIPAQPYGTMQICTHAFAQRFVCRIGRYGRENIR